MSIDSLSEDVEGAYADLGDSLSVPLDRESKHELAMLMAVLADDPGDLVQRGIHLLFQTTVDTGKLDFHLRNEYDLTYDEYLTGMTYEEMTGGQSFPPADDDRRYQF